MNKPSNQHERVSVLQQANVSYAANTAKPDLNDMCAGELRLMCANLQDRVAQLEALGRDARAVGIIHNGSAELNSIGRALPNHSPLYAHFDLTAVTHQIVQEASEMLAANVSAILLASGEEA